MEPDFVLRFMIKRGVDGGFLDPDKLNDTEKSMLEEQTIADLAADKLKIRNNDSCLRDINEIFEIIGNN